MKTTLNAIKNCSPCIEGYSKLLKFLGKTKADDEPLAVSVILESNGILDTVWCFRAVSGYDAEKRLFAVFCVRQIQHLLTDPRSINAIDVSERYAKGQATVEELKAAANAAYDAANDARATARATAYNDARAAAYDDARAAAYAANDAAYDAARAANVAYDVAYDAAAYYSVDSEIKPVLESYLKNMLSEAEK